MSLSEREIKDLVAAGVIDAATAERITAHLARASVEAAVLGLLPGAVRQTLPRYRAA